MRKKNRELANQTTALRLRQAGLRPTRQRSQLANLLFRTGHRHLTAEALHAEAIDKGIKVSLATVYNTLHQFTQAGLLRQVVVDTSRSYFDTNTGEHQHFYFEDDGTLTDIPGAALPITEMPPPPTGTKIKRVDVVVRVRRN
jgi:Fur family iron response transcriptional regulator